MFLIFLINDKVIHFSCLYSLFTNHCFVTFPIRELISGLFESSWWKLNLTKFQVVGCFMGTNRITFQSKLVLICKNLHILLLICTKMRKKRFCVRRDRTLAYCNRNRYSEVHFVKIAKYNSNIPGLVIDVFSSIKSRFALQ